jgi:predicted Holliday junction resolvase-like endonuclease
MNAEAVGNTRLLRTCTLRKERTSRMTDVRFIVSPLIIMIQDGVDNGTLRSVEHELIAGVVSGSGY